MRLVDVQRLLAHTKYYDGGIDGIYGPKTAAAMAVIERTQAAQLPDAYPNWNLKRRLIAIAQAILNALGYQAGVVDGYAGHNTLEAYRAWDHYVMRGQREEVDRTPEVQYPGPKNIYIPHEKDMDQYYGKPRSNELNSQLVQVRVPFKMRIDWNLDQYQDKMTLHKKCANNFVAGYTAAYQHYGDKHFRKLNLDRYAGAFNSRLKRGSKTSWSTHAYAVAVDFWASANGLRTRCPQAAFCAPVYEPFFNIMENHGFLSLGRMWGRDWMHIQAARI